MITLYFGKILQYFYVIIFLYCSSLQCYDNEYCAPDVCGGNGKHVLCKFQSQVPSSRCINHERIVNENTKRLILHKINDRRNKISAGEIKSLPPAVNMRKMAWRDELAKFAQRLADQCETNFDDVCNDIGQVRVGQTIATVYGESPGLTPASLVDVWYTELLNTNATIVARYRPSREVDASHYDYFTQLVWADSSEVGCGGVKYMEIHGEHNITVLRLICNFAPSGNRRGERVYSPGAPCASCPDYCDKEFTALCSPAIKNITIAESVSEEFKNETTAFRYSEQNKTQNLNKHTDKNEPISIIDEDFLPFDFLSHILNNTKQTITPSSQITQSTPCTGHLVIDDLVELIKKKLTNDPMFKEILATGKSADYNESTDASVSDFVGRIYSKKESPTTTKPVENDYVNSTLLADLVEAVIFRNADKYTITTQELVEPIFRFTADVNPIKIQPELAVIKTNNEFTGHYFFPEEDTEQTSQFLTSESYYDSESTDVPVSDVMLELENIKRNSETRDFVDDILESELEADSADEIVTTPANLDLYSSGHTNINKFLSGLADSESKGKDTNVGLKTRQDRKRRDKKYHKNPRQIQEKLFSQPNIQGSTPDTRKTCDKIHDSSVLHYGDLLGKLASDIKILKLNNHFPCSRGFSYFRKYKTDTLAIYVLIMNTMYYF